MHFTGIEFAEKKGYIAADDLRFVLMNLHSESDEDRATEEEIEGLLGDLDKDGDGEITYKEYVDMITKKK